MWCAVSAIEFIAAGRGMAWHGLAWLGKASQDKRIAHWQQCAYVLNTDAQAAMIDAHIKLMQAKKKALQNNADRARAALKQVMQLTGVTAIKSDDCTFKATLYKERDESIDVFDSLQLPPDYTREIPATYAPDKSLIKKAIKEGYEVPGAKLIKNDRLVIA